MDLILETLSLALPDYAFMDWESCASVFGCMPRGRYFQVMAHKDAGGGVFLKKVISTLTELYGEARDIASLSMDEALALVPTELVKKRVAAKQAQNFLFPEFQ